MKHSAAMGLSLLGGQCWGLAGPGEGLRALRGPGEGLGVWSGASPGGNRGTIGRFGGGVKASGIVWWDRVGERRWRGDDFTRGRKAEA